MLEKIIRFGLALVLLTNGLNYLFGILPTPELSIKASLMIGALERSGYFIQVTSIIQIVGAILYLINRYVGIANLIIAPTLLNLVLFSLFLEPSILIITAPAFGGLVYLFYTHKERYQPLFKR